MNEEAEFIELYGAVVTLAKACLRAANEVRAEEKDWPAGQKWDDLSGTSKSTFMRQARLAMGVEQGPFLETVRNWPFSDEGQQRIDNYFGHIRTQR